jgi:hypothetical protein
VTATMKSTISIFQHFDLHAELRVNCSSHIIMHLLTFHPILGKLRNEEPPSREKIEKSERLLILTRIVLQYASKVKASEFIILFSYN